MVRQTADVGTLEAAQAQGLTGLAPEEIRALIRTVPDFPAKGIQFRDITTLIAHAQGLTATIEHLALAAAPAQAQAVAGVEARGFIFGAALAIRLGIGFVPVRKAGKLPVPSIGIDYALEYGSARIELDPEAIDAGERVLLVDDLLATGGTALAATQLLRQAGAVVEHALFVVDLPDLGGGDLLRRNGVACHAVVEFAGH
jgi:adenine phosphoribosyltransferase